MPGKRERGVNKNFKVSTCIAMVYTRSGGLCERCGRKGESYHHRLKRSQGGLWTPSNIVLVCGHGTAGCHGWIEHNANDADSAGYHVRPWEKPEEKPVRTCIAGWALLDDDGSYHPASVRE
ncbi:HNH endonuclease [Mycobacterium phage Kumao]|uniref:HNH endonuclease n=1 Tax=Mycobacterium phage Kumao TaxID=2041344 RepID=A0A2D1GPX9_9CAUD|nr:HNH endonuclease [Mycobacterium phage Kumao]ATN94025.1 HNH endonuclease [Mycobacterium phage Kumao]